MTEPPSSLQTIYVEKTDQAAKLAERLCKAGYYFICRMSPTYPGRLFSFSTSIDFQRNAKLFAGIFYNPREL